MVYTIATNLNIISIKLLSYASCVLCSLGEWKMQNNVIKHGPCVMNCFCGIIQRNIFLLKNPYRKKIVLPWMSNFALWYFSPLTFLFFIQSFLFFSQAVTIYRTAREERGPPFTPPYHFHQLTKHQTFTCIFAREITITHF